MLLQEILYIKKIIQNFTLPDAGDVVVAAVVVVVVVVVVAVVVVVVVSLVIGADVVVGILGELHKDSLQQITEQLLYGKLNPVVSVSNKLHASWLH